MNTKNRKLIPLLTLVCLIACSFTLMACANLGGVEKTIYSLTVSKAEGVEIDLTGVTAQWKSGGAVKASCVLDESGTASVVLAKGDYTVTLTGAALADYEWKDATVSATDLTASIVLTKKGAGEEEIDYSVAVTTNDSDLNLSTLAVQWIGASGTESCVLGADGTATIKLKKGDYNVTVIGFTKPTYYTVTTDTVSAEKLNAAITVTAIARDVAVTVESPVDLPAGVKVQVKDSGENYGEPVAIAENKANVKVPFNKEVTLELVGLSAYDYLESSAVTVSAADKTATLSVSLTTVTYTVNVVKGEYDGEVDDLTVTLEKNGSAVTEATELPLAEGVASVSLMAGEYTVILDGLNMVDYKYELSEPLTVENHETTVTILSTLIKLEKKDSNGATVYEAATVFESEEEVKRVVLPSELTVGKFYSILLSSESDLFNDYNFTITYNTDDVFTVGKDRHDNEEDSFIVICLAEGEYQFTLQIKDGGLFTEEINISVQEYEEIDTVIELGVEKEVYATTTYTFAVAKDNAYLISVDAANLNDFSINIGEGAILGKDSDSKATTYEFYALEGEVTEVSVYLYASVTIKLTITETYGDLRLDEEHDITLGGWYAYSSEKPTFKVPSKAIYKIEIVSDNVKAGDVGVSVGGKDPILDDDSSVKEAQFNATNGEQIYFTFYSWGQSAANATIKVKISIVKKTGNILEVGGQNTAKVSNTEKPGRFVIEGAEAGKNYRIVVLTPPVLGKATFYLGYADHTGENALTFTRGTGDNGYSAEYVFIDFEYVAGENAIEIYTNSGSIGEITVELKDPGKEEVKLGPGGSVTVDKVTSDHIVIKLDTSALRHGTPYVITGNFFAMWVGNGGLKLKYGDAVVNFANAGDWANCKAEFTFVEDDFLSGPNVIEIYTDGAEWPDPVTFTLTAK